MNKLNNNNKLNNTHPLTSLSAGKNTIVIIYVINSDKRFSKEKVLLRAAIILGHRKFINNWDIISAMAWYLEYFNLEMNRRQNFGKMFLDLPSNFYTVCF